jgi:hypothetical protein
VERYRGRTVTAMDPMARARMQRPAPELPFPETMPAYGAILADRGGGLWVQEYAPPWEEGPVRWTVFDPDGRQLGTLALPPRFRATDVGADYVLGVAQDELDVQQVQMYRLDRRRG